jgi:hypothetical protein
VAILLPRRERPAITGLPGRDDVVRCRCAGLLLFGTDYLNLGRVGSSADAGSTPRFGRARESVAASNAAGTTSSALLARGRADAHLPIGSYSLDAVELVPVSRMSDINPDLHAFPNVLEYPGVGRVQLNAILELEQIEGAIDEAYRAYLRTPYSSPGPSATACLNDIATPSAMVVSNTRYRMCVSSRYSVLSHFSGG